MRGRVRAGGIDFAAEDAVASQLLEWRSAGGFLWRNPDEFDRWFGDLRFQSRNFFRNWKNLDGDNIRIGRSFFLRGPRTHAVGEGRPGTRRRVLRVDRVFELNVLFGGVGVEQSAGHRVDELKGFVVRLAIGFQSAAENFDSRRLGEPFVSDRVCR